MFEWNRTVQRMINWVEEHLEHEASLVEMAWQLGYSPFYCTKQFHAYTGMTLRDYIRLRRVCMAALELRDTDRRILDIAVKWSFSSQEAFTRAFQKAYGVSPAAYRKSPEPIPLLLRQITFDPYLFGLGENNMGKDFVKNVETRIEVLPHHKFIGIKNIDADGYFRFWELQESIPGLDCHKATGILESMGGMFGQVGGWFYQDGRKGYLYGVQMSGDYAGKTPEGMICLDIPEGEYAVFFHPPFEYEEICESVDARVAETAAGFDPTPRGFEWDYGKPEYQRHDPEAYGTAIYRPLRKIEK